MNKLKRSKKQEIFESKYFQEILTASNALHTHEDRFIYDQESAFNTLLFHIRVEADLNQGYNLLLR